ncbi:hypothetical protein [Falsiporphyromonas endometrii]|uniref:hypothetical protein n=1 Tax=Falsiporphyromonas endometrii TaxID=1387297 RepID=UPI0036D2F646
MNYLIELYRSAKEQTKRTKVKDIFCILFEYYNLMKKGLFCLEMYENASFFDIPSLLFIYTTRGAQPLIISLIIRILAQ